jgi:hypothetical protein
MLGAVSPGVCVSQRDASTAFAESESLDWTGKVGMQSFKPSLLGAEEIVLWVLRRLDLPYLT